METRPLRGLCKAQTFVGKPDNTYGHLQIIRHTIYQNKKHRLSGALVLNIFVVWIVHCMCNKVVQPFAVA